MKFFYIILFLSTLNIIDTNAQSPGWQWAKSAGGSSQDRGKNITTDANGNVLVVGSFASASINFGATTLTTLGNTDIFVVKYNASGNVLWAKSAGGTSMEEGSGISTDGNGNVLVTGSFSSPTINFGSIILNNSNPGFDDMFVVKYNSSGIVQWAKTAGGPSFDLGLGISTDANGNVFVVGNFYGPTITFGTTTLNNANNSDLYIVKYNSSGTVMWAKSAGEMHYDQGIGVATDVTGNVVTVGHFQSDTLTFGAFTLTNSGSASTSDIYIVKYDVSGNVLWAKSAIGTGTEFESSIASDGSGNYLVTGFYTGDSLTFGTTTITNSGSATNQQFFIVKYDSSGSVLWAHSEGGTLIDGAYDISTDANGNAIAIGYFLSPSITFGTTVLTNTDTTGSTADIFVVKYDASGNILWAKSTGGTDYDLGYGIATDANGNVLVTGYFSNASINFDTITLPNAGLMDVYVAKLDTSAFTGIAEEHNFMDSFTIYPNPTNEQITIESPVNINEIKIINLSGQIVYESKQVKNHLSLHFEEAGIYFVQIITENQTVTKKLIVYK